MHYLFLTSIAIILWASLAALVAELAHLPPFFLLACCLLIGGSLSLFHFRKWQFNTKILLTGVGGIFGYHFFLFMALRLAPPVTANLLNYLWPLFILLFTPLFLPGTKITARHIAGTLIAFFGAGLILLQSSLSLSVDHTLGYVLAIVAAVIWAVYSLLTKRMASFGTATVGLFCLVSGLLSITAHLFLEQPPTVVFKDWLKIILLGLGPMGLAFYCWNSALKKGDPRVIASLSYFIPLLSTALLIIFNDQPFTLITFYSMLFIVSGAILASIPKKVVI